MRAIQTAVTDLIQFATDGKARIYNIRAPSSVQDGEVLVAVRVAPSIPDDSRNTEAETTIDIVSTNIDLAEGVVQSILDIGVAMSGLGGGVSGVFDGTAEQMNYTVGDQEIRFIGCGLISSEINSDLADLIMYTIRYGLRYSIS